MALLQAKEAVARLEAKRVVKAKAEAERRQVWLEEQDLVKTQGRTLDLRNNLQPFCEGAASGVYIRCRCT